MPETRSSTAQGAPPSLRWFTVVVELGPALFPLAIGLLSLTSDLRGTAAVWWPVAALVVAVALVVRTRHPLGAWLASMATVASAPLAGGGAAYVLLLLVPALPLVALVGAWPTRRSLAAAAVTVVGLAAVGIESSPAAQGSLSVALRLAVALPLAAVATAWLTGYALRVRRRYEDALLDRARSLERERHAVAAQAVAEERARIGQEFHDVVGHHVTVMIVQAEAAEAVWDVAPDQARAAVGAVAEIGREAVGELRTAVRAIGGPAGDGEAGRTAGGLRDLETLVDRVRATGVAVKTLVEGDPGRLPTTVDRAALRIIQEALTNVLRHARAGRVSVELRLGHDALRLRVVDDGVGPAGAPAAGGRGLPGMRERAAGLGGLLEVRPGPGGGTVVEAHLPLGAAGAPPSLGP